MDACNFSLILDTDDRSRSAHSWQSENAAYGGFITGAQVTGWVSCPLVMDPFQGLVPLSWETSGRPVAYGFEIQALSGSSIVSFGSWKTEVSMHVIDSRPLEFLTPVWNEPVGFSLPAHGPGADVWTAYTCHALALTADMSPGPPSHEEGVLESIIESIRNLQVDEGDEETCQLADRVLAQIDSGENEDESIEEWARQAASDFAELDD